MRTTFRSNGLDNEERCLAWNMNDAQLGRKKREIKFGLRENNSWSLYDSQKWIVSINFGKKRVRIQEKEC